MCGPKTSLRDSDMGEFLTYASSEDRVNRAAQQDCYESSKLHAEDAFVLWCQCQSELCITHLR